LFILLYYHSGTAFPIRNGKIAYMPEKRLLPGKAEKQTPLLFYFFPSSSIMRNSTYGLLPIRLRQIKIFQLLVSHKYLHFSPAAFFPYLSIRRPDNKPRAPDLKTDVYIEISVLVLLRPVISLPFFQC
jgi:hypothetical protein